jgi:hypothetical protein
MLVSLKRTRNRSIPSEARPVVRMVAVAVLLGCAGCADKAVRHSARDAGDLHDAGYDDAAQQPLASLVTDVVSAYDRQVMTNCPCFVEMGAYGSVDECVQLLAPGPTWVSCATNALAAYDTPQGRMIMQCYLERTQALTDCLATMPCQADARASCGGVPLECATADPELTLMLAMACPDISLLPRLNGM